MKPKLNNNSCTFCKRVFLFCACFILVHASLGLSAQETGKLPRPVIPIGILKKYSATINELDSFLVEKKIWDFYKLTNHFFETLSENYEVQNFEYSVEDLMALEWTFYLLAAAPLLDDEEYLLKNELEPKNKMNDSLIKQKFIFHIKRASLNDEILAERFASAYGQMKMEIPSRDKLLEMARQTRVNQIVYYAAMTRFYITVNGISKEELKNAKFIPTEGFKAKELPPFDAPKGASDEEILRRLKKYNEEEQKNIDPAHKKFNKKLERIVGKKMSIDPRSDDYKRDFVYRLVATFPRDGAKVQQFLRLAGYATDEECAGAIRTIFPKTQETAYLYEGLVLSKESARSSK